MGGLRTPAGEGGLAGCARDRARGRKCLVRMGLRGHHPHPPAPSPASGRGGDALVARGRSGQFSPANRGGGFTVLLPSPRVGERGRG
jgi:hypothetical protein